MHYDLIIHVEEKQKLLVVPMLRSGCFEFNRGMERGKREEERGECK